MEIFMQILEFMYDYSILGLSKTTFIEFVSKNSFTGAAYLIISLFLSQLNVIISALVYINTELLDDSFDDIFSVTLAALIIPFFWPIYPFYFYSIAVKKSKKDYWKKELEDIDRKERSQNAPALPDSNTGKSFTRLKPFHHKYSKYKGKKLVRVGKLREDKNDSNEE